VHRYCLPRGSMSESASPVVPRRRLRVELRRARQQARLTQEAVAAAMDWSLSKIIRIENGAVGISRNDLIALLRLYNVDSAERIEELVALARVARQQSWWSKYRDDVPPAYFQYLEYEAGASVIRQYEALLIPGLLQTPDYAATAIRQYRGHHPGHSTHAPDAMSPEIIKTRVELRMTRQQLLQRSNPPQLYFVLDEAVIWRTIGDIDLRSDQIARLIEMANRPNVSIQILPFAVGLYAGMAENFTILEFPDADDNNVLYFESAQNAIFSHEEDQELSTYREMYEDLRKISLRREDSLAYLVKTARDIA